VLTDLSVKNFAIVEDVRLSLGAGFTVITGETGAGKSILVDAVALLAGGRASSSLLRADADRLAVAARFELDGLSPGRREEAGLPESGELILRREVTAEGRSRAFLNDEPATARAVVRASSELVFIHGQGQERGLLDPEAPLLLLDSYGGLEELTHRVAAACSRFQAAERRRAELSETSRERDRRMDALRFEAQEIAAARLGDVDESGLASERNRLLHADRVRQLGQAALSALTEDERSAADRLGEACRAFDDLARIDPAFSGVVREADELKARISDLARAAAPAATEADADPARLAEIESVLDRISRLKKKYGPDLEDVRARGQAAEAEMASLATLDDALEECEKQAATALSEYESAADELARLRRASAAKLSAAVEKQLKELAMEKATLRIEVADRPDPVSRFGRDRAEMRFAPNPGEPERPLAQIASGGELSRAELAIESARLAKRKDPFVRTLVFDEVDAGVGGRVAEVVGRKLRELSARDQVLCVTHVPQIAALADRHLRATKAVSGGRTRAVVEELSREERIEEIARMLAGRTVTKTAREHARSLLLPR